MNLFTSRQESQIRRALNHLMKCGTAHMLLCDATEIYTDEETGLTWYNVRARMPYMLQDTDTGEIYTDDKTYEIHVGVTADRRCSVYTTLDTSQHDPHRRPAL